MKIINVCTNCQLLIYNDAFGPVEVVFSYGVPVASYSGNDFHRHWDGYSVTTLRHINKALKPSTPITKKTWEAMEIREIEFPNAYA